MGRAPCCDKTNVKKGPWSPEEDSKLKSYIEQNGTGGNWIALPTKIGLRRCGKSCRLRWLNYLRPNIRHGGFSEEEDNIICSLYMSIGSRWSIIAGQLPGRTDNDIKNYWNTRLKKKLLGKYRKDQHSLVRRINSLNHEKKIENFIPPRFLNQTQSCSVPIMNSDQDPCFEDQTFLRNFPTAQYDVQSTVPAMLPASNLGVQFDGFDDFYTTEMTDGGSATTSGESGGWSEEMKAFDYPLMAGITQLDSGFEFGFQ